jgi:hypothetical protein
LREAPESWRIVNTDAWRKDPIKEVAWTGYGRREHNPAIVVKHTEETTTTEYPVVLSRRRPRWSDATPSGASNGQAKGTASDLKARLSLVPVFLRRVFAHPSRDFTLVRRGKEVMVVERGADLSGKDLRGVELRKADLSDAILKGTDLTGAVLREANLRGANLEGAILDGTDFGRADLRGTEVDPAALRRAKFVGAILDDDLRGDVRRFK